MEKASAEKGIKINKDRVTSTMKSQERYRAKVEERELLDKGQDMRDKYGLERGWKMSLRNNIKSIDCLIEY